MGQGRQGLRLQPHPVDQVIPPREMTVQQLDDHAPPQRPMLAQKHLAHAPAAERRQGAIRRAREGVRTRVVERHNPPLKLKSRKSKVEKLVPARLQGPTFQPSTFDFSTSCYYSAPARRRAQKKSGSPVEFF